MKRFLSLLFILGPGWADQIRSTKTCLELGRPFRASIDLAFAPPSACGASEIGPSSALCPAPMTWTAAKTLCEGMGARLCTAQEITRDFVRGTGCGLDSERVWSSTDGVCTSDRVTTLAGSSLYQTSNPTKCSLKEKERYPVRCCADQYARTTPTVACQANECSSTSDASNKCVDLGNGDYTCDCKGVGWTRGPNSKSCINLSQSTAPTPAADPCLKDPCSSSIEPRNACRSSTTGKGIYQCTCNGVGWTTAVGYQSCIPPANKCKIADPCSSSLAVLNTCIDLGMGKYRCECNSKAGWIVSSAADRCISPTSPCRQPRTCSTAGFPSNICTDLPGGAYRCQCGTGFTVNSIQTACICNDPCLSADRCSSSADGANTCYNLYSDELQNCGAYTCRCGGRAWTPSADGLFCQKQSPCDSGDPCSTTGSFFNECIRIPSSSLSTTATPKYTCSCDTDAGWITPEGAQSCHAPNPCDDLALNGDPCQTQVSTDNICLASYPQGTGVLGNFSCQCGGLGWVAAADGLSCQICPNPCWTDPCHSGMDSANQCNFRPVTFRSDLRAFEALPQCGVYECDCNGALWTESFDKQACISCAHPCSSDPCRTQASLLNICLEIAGGVGMCATYTCNCGPGYSPSIGNQACQAGACPNPCLSGDPCSTVGNPRNTCRNPSCGTYQCGCFEPGWVTPASAQNCQTTGNSTCLNPCLLNDPCSSSQNSQNLCVRIPKTCGAYSCQCAKGWSSSFDGLSCLVGIPGSACPNPCLNGNLCSSTGNLGNVCLQTPKSCGYTCSCFAPGWGPSASSLTSCVQTGLSGCQNPCSSANPCNTNTAGNNCVPTAGACGLYTCSCLAPGWTSGNGGLSCYVAGSGATGCSNPCNSGDLCSSIGHVGNVCIQPPNTCNQYICSCYSPGWGPSNNGLSCSIGGNSGGCVNPCTTGDLCSSNGNIGNVCVQIPNTCGQYSCSCSAPGWGPANQGLTCFLGTGAGACANPCTGVDRCSSNGYPGNICLPVPGTCGRYVCTCGATGWSSINNGLACSSTGSTTTGGCTNPCLTSNPCKSEAGNTCTQPPGTCGQYICYCSANDYYTAPGGQSCTYNPSQACINPCTLGDPCVVAGNPLNTCTQPPGACGTYACTCSQPGYTTSFSALTCQGGTGSSPTCTNPCSGSDRCSSAANPNNLCVQNVNRCGQYVCSCAPGWNPTTGGLGCSQTGSAVTGCTNPCTMGVDLCSSTGNLGNQCIQTQGTCGQYLCSCYAPGWGPSNGGLSCTIGGNSGGCVNPCTTGDLCSSNGNLGNVCVQIPNTCGRYTCSCSAPGWGPGSGGLSCAGTTSGLGQCNPCVGVDRCNSNGYPGNTCIQPQGTCGQYTCSCAAPGWGPSSTGLNCLSTGSSGTSCVNPCATANPPCQPQAGNTCIQPPGTCGQFICRCLFPSFYTAAGAQSCVSNPGGSCINPCNLGDPCSTSGNFLNSCTQPSGACGTYACTCSQPGWTTSWGAQSCQNTLVSRIGSVSNCSNPCTADLCNSTNNPGNVCNPIPNACGQYVCSCSAPGWSPANNGLGCASSQVTTGCANPCSGADLCSTAASGNVNTCIQIPNTCGQYVCSCSASGWSPASGGLSCTQGASSSCPNPCLSADPCTSRATGNACVQTPGVCGQYICRCTAAGYFTSSGAQSCIVAATRSSCVNPCTEADPCSTSTNPQNLCVQPIGTCGVYACACSGGWVPSFGAQSCKALNDSKACPNPCVGTDRCSTSGNAGNLCVQLPNTCGQYVCSCSAPGWSTANAGQSCSQGSVVVQSCPNPCLVGDVCSSTAAGNLCVQPPNTCGEYICRCFATGYYTAPGAHSCLVVNPPQACINPCTLGDPCATSGNPQNLCSQPTGTCGLYSCSCSQPGWFAPWGALACQQATNVVATAACDNPCAGTDRCSTKDNSANRCVQPPNTCGQYSCSCAPGWTASNGGFSCSFGSAASVSCNDTCVGVDRCSSKGNPGNVCVNVPGACGKYLCSCSAPGWGPANAGFSCTKISTVLTTCPNPCTTGNPCATQAAGNTCVQLPGSCDQFLCQCSAAGYYSAPGSRSCLASPSQACINPCNQGDPCSSIGNPQNLCTQPVGTCGVYACVCSQPGWVIPWGAQTCQQSKSTTCNNPCVGADRCSSGNPGNVCVQLPQTCDQYTCSCSASGWSSANSGLSCVQATLTTALSCSNPCLANNPCSSGAQGNVCIQPPNTCGQYLCRCFATGYYTAPGAQSCAIVSPAQACINPCTQGDACASTSNPQNQCVQPPGTCGVYSCSCSQPGWTTSWGAQSCQSVGGSNCTNPCSTGDRCTSMGNPGNICVQPPNTCGQYTCSCSAAGFGPSKDGLTCTRTSGSVTVSSSCVNPCLMGDKCNSTSAGNVCVQIPNSCGQYSCSCSAPGWTRTNGGLGCSVVAAAAPCANPCLTGDPCLSVVQGNVCLQPPGTCGQYICRCFASGYYTAPGARSCAAASASQPCVNPCTLGDPCSTAGNPQNLCSQPTGTCGVYTCACSQPGFAASWGSQSCDAGTSSTSSCLNPCTSGDRCSSSSNLGNICIQPSGTCGQYTCSCSAPGFGPSNGNLACSYLSDSSVCANPCLSANRCNSSVPGNTCVALPTKCGQYACSCAAPGWTASNGGLGCSQNLLTTAVACPNPCSNGDPCSSGNQGNVCVQPPNTCEQYICRCYASGYYTAPGARSCVVLPSPQACVNPCTLGDPCFSTGNPQNLCVQPVGTCGVYACACSQPGWTTSWGAQTCQSGASPTNVSCADPCLTGDRCSSNGNAGNVCAKVPNTCGQYVCSCSAAGWGPSNASLSCSRSTSAQCINPCAIGDPCLSSVQGNTCLQTPNSCDQFICRCYAPGYSTAPGARSCVGLANKLGCLNPCNQGDPCSSKGNPLNLCVQPAGSCGVYACACSQSGWSTSWGAQTCKRTGNATDGVACISPCANADPCNGAANPGNMCVQLPDTCDKYVCSCAAPGWQSANSGLTCSQGQATATTACANPCATGDPCSAVYSGNWCVQTPNSCNQYTCRCSAPGYYAPSGALSCAPVVIQVCQNPCTQGDPCSAVGHPQNSCSQPAGACGTYVCSCAEPGWIVGLNAQSCQAPVSMTICDNPCQFGDLCSSKANPDNKCAQLPGACNKYSCTCSGGWIAGNGSTSCLRDMIAMRTGAVSSNVCTNPCIVGDPCSARVEGNGCIRPPNTCDEYICQCYAPGYYTAAGARSCLVVNPPDSCMNPCNQPGDPCATAGNPQNLCVQAVDQCGAYACSCSQAGWIATWGAQSCRQIVGESCPNRCATSNPCSSENSGNLCTPVPNSCGQYVCVCSAKGFIAPPGAQFCQASGCATDPCAGKCSTDTVGNLCYPGATCNDFYCACSASGYTAGIGSQSCIKCTDGCTSGDPCVTGGGSTGNQCQLLSTRCGAFACTCATGYTLGANSMSCVPCFNPCDVGDPCGSLQSSQNRCVPRGCGDYVCQCMDSAYLLAADSKGCTRCADSCASGDPCRTSYSAANQCIPASGGICGLYSCSCDGVGWLTPPGAKACLARPDPCANGNKCQTQFGGNQCIKLPNSNDYACQCSAPGWYSSVGSQTCERCVNPCDTDPCRVSGNSQNYCIPDYLLHPGTNCGSFTCTCQTPGYVATPDLKACTRCADTCATSDPCFSKSNPANVCSSVQGADCGLYTCVCSAQGWITPLGAKTCQPCPNACDIGDPCSTRGSQNLCVSTPGRCGQYTCQCASGWIATLRSQTCLKCVDPCANNPCSSAEDPTNKCVPVYDTTSQLGNPGSVAQCATYVCTCQGVGYLGTPDAQSCTKCANSCANDPCQSVGSPGNVCIPGVGGICGLYTCQCNEPGWSTPLGGKVCRKCPDPCSRDPCSTSLNSANACIIKPGSCGEYTCQCNAPGWLTPSPPNNCQACLDPCASDPCSRAFDSSNRCIPNPNPGGLTCGGYSCTCGGVGFTASADLQSCTRCANTCLNSNPCFSTGNPGNRCVPGQGGVCGIYTCQCQEPGWSTPLGAKTCLKCPNPCERSDPCQSIGNVLNSCIQIPGTCGEYTCQCGQPGWLAPVKAQTCTRCPDPCAQDPCGAQVEPRNRCVNIPATQVGSCGTWLCQCAGDVYLPSPDLKSCIKCTSGCEGIDPCQSRSNPGNRCLPQTGAVCGLYTCECNANWWMAPVGAKSCQYCPNPCDSNPCGPTPNMCTRTPGTCSDYQCQCTSGWVVAYQMRSCAKCYDPCTSRDPCNSKIDAGNRCIANLDPGLSTPTVVGGVAYCGSFICQCSGAGFLAASDNLSCKRCANTCSNSDPCFSQGNPGNKCSPASGDCSLYTCQCSQPGWTNTPGAASCRRCQNPCEVGDPCQTGRGASNVCVQPPGTCGAYVCQCNTPGWVTPYQAQSCTQCPDPCQNPGFDPCNSARDPANKCVVIPSTSLAVCASFVCQCAGNGFLPAPDSRSCTQCQDTCVTSDPCSSRLYPGNQCTPAQGGVCGLYTCQCKQPGWVTPLGAKSCQACLDPCQLDPCFSSSSGNTCIQIPDTCGAFTCQCNALGWVTPAGAQSCRKCNNPCTNSDACSTSGGAGNVCTPTFGRQKDYCGGYTCQCGAPGYLPSPDGASCVKCTDSCSVGDPCSTADHPGNVCLSSPAICGSYTCQCRAPGYINTLGAKACQICAQPCLTGDPCSSGIPGNMCVALPGQCGAYVCQCQASGWISSYQGLGCQRCNDACLSGDPCSSGLDSGNKCVMKYTPFSSGANGGVPGATVDCGFAVCQCGGVGFFPTADGKGCMRCADTCAISDPCFSKGAPGNKCLAMSGGICGLYICQCLESGWITPAGGKTCQRCIDPCATGDPCATRVSSGNVCTKTPGQCGQYTCQCSASGWVESYQSQSCERCNNPCAMSDLCSSKLDPANVCTPTYSTKLGPAGVQCGGHTCRCNGAGYLPSADSTSCTRCNNACDSDPCFSAGRAGNRCVAAQGGICGLYTCSCNEPGWITPPGGKTCQECINPCSLGDPCRTASLGNICVPLPECGAYVCQCGAPGWVSQLQSKACTQCPNVCNDPSDPCGIKLDPRNTCIQQNTDQSQCGYRCQCGGEGFLPSQSLTSCTRCTDSCVTGDVCFTRAGPGNKCIPAQGGICGLYTCQCLASGWTTPLGAKTCQKCPNPCAQGDPCVTAGTSNVCLPLAGSCGEYTCQCGIGWVASFQSQTCQHCYDPCASGDPCGTKIDGNNLCIFRPRPQSVGNSSGVFGAEVSCGGFSCQCGGKNFLATSDSRSCYRCSDTCATSDPCFSSANRENKCIPAQGGVCGLFTCQCSAPGWMNVVGGKTCQQCSNPCLTGDPCNGRQNPGNICLQPPGTCGQYVCSCGALGWITPYQGQSCQKCFDPCINGDPCSSAADASNRCTRTFSLKFVGNVSGSAGSLVSCGGYSCQCGGQGYFSSPDASSCTRCQDSCTTGDPCFTRGNAGNECRPAVGGLCGLYQCVCNAQNWMTPLGAKTCQQCRSPCDVSDPCMSRANGGNVCLQLPGQCGAYTCSCATGWVASYKSQTCQECANLCIAGDPCKSLADPGNVCIRDLASPNYGNVTGVAGALVACGSFTCQCSAKGFVPGPFAKSCQTCPDPCLNNPCSSDGGPGNVCVPGAGGVCGLYTCRCQEPGWVTPPRAQSCQKCLNPCDADPCFSSATSNSCLQLPGTCGEYTCQCGTGWIAPYQAQTCQRCYSVCTTGDPCSSQLDSANRCVPQANNNQGNSLSTPGALVNCGTFVCQCGGTGFVPSQDQKSCTRCSDTCATSDPCFSRQNSGNICLPASGGICGLYTCQCRAKGWITPPGAKTCQQCVNPCESGDPCFTSFGALNSCLQPVGTCGQYVCQCQEPGWVTPFDARTCQRCKDPCSSDPCGSRTSGANLCVPIRNGFYGNSSGSQGAEVFCGSFICQCGAQGYLTGIDQKSCLTCPDPCLSDPCYSKGNRGNMCYPAQGGQCGLYTCVCAASGWSIASNGRTCSKCPDPCALGDPCVAGAGNICKVLPGTCGQYICDCPASGWYAPPQQQSCQRCADPCANDPCSVSGHPGNKCLPTFRRAIDSLNPLCSGFVCQCEAPGYLVTGTGTACSFCQDACSSDPCSSTHPGNRCVRDPKDCSIPICECRAEGFITPPGARSCQACGNVCLLDPCSSAGRPGNQCTRSTASCDRYTCSCAEVGWVTPAGAQYCQTCDNKCLSSDPCKVTALGNRCVRIPADCTKHVCDCQAVGWLAAPDGQSCLRCVDPCSSHDNCMRTSGSALNQCVPKYGGGSAGCTTEYSCSCDNVQWQSSPDGSRCERCPNPCEKASDSCQTLQDPGNSCLPGSAQQYCAGVFTCTCGRGWVRDANSQQCKRCADPCGTNPCFTSQEPMNKCSAIYLPTENTPAAKDPNAGCAIPVCDCKGSGWLTAYGARTCTKCQDPCSSDPCSTKGTGNRCVPAQATDSQGCGGYICECSGRGYVAAGDRMSCSKCFDPCASDPCRVNSDTNNQCLTDQLPGTCARGYTCMCGGNFMVTQDGKQCAQCIDPCTSDPCSSKQDQRNMCQPDYRKADTTPYATIRPDGTALCGGYLCVCNGANFIAKTGALQSCIYCDDPCQRDPCLSLEDSRNQCASVKSPNTCGIHSCQCSAPGYISADQGKSCKRCVDPCSLDPCGSRLDDRNTCVNLDDGFSCGNFICTCMAEGWVTPLDSKSCVKCENPCLMFGDPCNSKLDSRNYCVPSKSVQSTVLAGLNQCDKAYTCQCNGEGWVTGLQAQACHACPHPCQGDPCNTGRDYLNRCVPNGPVPILSDTTSQPSSESKTSPSLWDLYESRAQFDQSSTRLTREFTDTPDPYASRGLPSTTFVLSNGPLLSTITGAVPNSGSVQVSRGTFAIGAQSRNPISIRNGTFPLLDASGYPASYAGIGGNLFPQVNNFVVPGVDYSTCPSYHCQCEGRGWLAPPEAKACAQCNNPCLQGDPCSRNADNLNVCRPKIDFSSHSFSNSVDWFQQNCQSFTCDCQARGFTVGPFGQSCIACVTPCSSGDPCNSNLDDGNKCVTVPGLPGQTCGDYTCQCKGRGFLATNPKSCQRCVNPCDFDDPCKTAAGPSNKCVPDYTNMPFDAVRGVCMIAYTCVCANDGFLVAPNQLTCEYCPNACSGSQDPCGAQMNPLNKCNFQGLQFLSSTRDYQSNGYSTDGTFFTGGADDVAPASTGPAAPGSGIKDRSAVGVYSFSQFCRGFTCQCGAPNWMLIPGGQRCQLCSNPCENPRDPCLTKADPRNLCVPIASVTGQCSFAYTCTCAGVGYMVGPSASTCQNCPNPCLQGDPCMSNSDPRNLCFPEVRQDGDKTVCGGYRCACGALGWVTPTGAQSCQSCRDPCASDPCMAKSDPRNFCALGRVGGGVSSIAGRRLLQAPVAAVEMPANNRPTMRVVEMPANSNPANSNPLRVVEMPANSNPPLIPNSGSIGVVEVPGNTQCSSYVCHCDAPGYVSNGGQYCVPSCLDPCSNGDPCAMSKDKKNRCVPLPPALRNGAACSPGYWCDCGGVGFIPSSDQQTCNVCRDGCSSGDPCRGNADPRNICVPVQGLSKPGPAAPPRGCGTYVCQCGAPGWAVATGGQSCQPCDNPCLKNDPCNRLADPSNVCIPVPSLFTQPGLCGSYRCQCSGAGWRPSPSLDSCKRCPDPCTIDSDPCLTRLSSGNRCVPTPSTQYNPFTRSADFVDLGYVRAHVVTGDRPSRRSATSDAFDFTTANGLTAANGCESYRCVCDPRFSGSQDYHFCLPFDTSQVPIPPTPFHPLPPNNIPVPNNNLVPSAPNNPVPNNKPSTPPTNNPPSPGNNPVPNRNPPPMPASNGVSRPISNGPISINITVNVNNVGQVQQQSITSQVTAGWSGSGPQKTNQDSIFTASQPQSPQTQQSSTQSVFTPSQPQHNSNPQAPPISSTAQFTPSQPQTSTLTKQQLLQQQFLIQQGQGR